VNPPVTVGIALAGGFFVFLIGAAAWRMAYQQPLISALPIIHADRRRRAWIHLWMMAGTIVTAAGLAGLASVDLTANASALTAMAFGVYGMGAMCMLVSLAFMLTVVPWAAGRTVEDGAPPEHFAAFDAWAGALYLVFMVASYTAFVLLGTALLGSTGLPRWLGWLGVGGGASLLLGFAITRFDGPFNPPILAHTYPAVVGAVLITT
jgi:hypothetical protein